MDGQYHNREYAHEQIIGSWMLTTIENGGVTRYDDLHIDRIDDEWKSPGLWVPAAFHAQDIAIEIRNRHGVRFSVVIGFSLSGGMKRQEVNFNTRAQFEALFNQTPPSLYLFRLGMEPWVQPHNAGLDPSGEDLVIKKIDSSIFGRLASSKDCWYIEFNHRAVDGYCRSAFVSEGRTGDPAK